MRWKLGLGALTASWGFIAVLVAAVDLGAEAPAFWRPALAAATLALGAIVVRRPELLAPRGRLPALVFLGVVQGVHWLLFFETVKHGSVAPGFVLTFYAAPLLLALVAPLVLPERWSAVVLGAASVGAVGIALIALDSGDGRPRHGPSPRVSARPRLRRARSPIEAPAAGRDASPTVAFWDCAVGAAVVAPVLVVAGRIVPNGVDEWAAVLAPRPPHGRLDAAVRDLPAARFRPGGRSP